MTIPDLSPTDLPAILGGEAAFPDGPPTWPRSPWPEVDAAVSSAMRDGSWGRYHGPQCRQLVEDLVTFHSAEHVQLCSSGTVAVELALRGAKVEAGDEVLLAAYDFKANFQNVLAVGAIPVLVDLDPNTWQLNPARLEEACSEKTRAVIASHLHGGLVDLNAVCEFAAERNIVVIEDACQATGAMVSSRRAGMTGDVGVLSFGGSKLLTSGRGGAVLTSRADIAQRIRLYTQRGNDAYPLSELQSAVLLPQLGQLDEWNTSRLARAKQLASSLAAGGLPLKPMAPLNLATANRPAFYKLGFQYTGESLSRDRLCAALRLDGVALDPGFRALHRTHSRRRFRSAGELPESDRADESCVMLHHPVLLQDERFIEQVVLAMERILNHADEVAAAPEPAC
ncbi:MAG: aminotransferase class V-fold PLP-dependent enzyme [Planctomycetes bacterium]|nr:aminotransferase class V-fold PLP-dependent enzyme [Planctomycetota bacterium]